MDAIIGSNKFLHTVLWDECIGCGLCVAPCPVDCIDMVPLATVLPPNVKIDKPTRAARAKQRHQARQLRLQQEEQRVLPVYASPEQRQASIKQEIKEALARVRAKKKNEPTDYN